MAKQLKEILEQEGLEEVETPSASAALGRSDAASRASLGGAEVIAPTIGEGKVKGKESLVKAAADAFRSAAGVGEASAESRSAMASDAGSRTGKDLKLVRVKSKSPSRADASAGDKVVVVSQSKGKIIGRQG